jgi:hypothetical protein
LVSRIARRVCSRRLPAGLHDARKVAAQREVAQRDTRQTELAIKATWASGNGATVAHAHRAGVARHLVQSGNRLFAALRIRLGIRDHALELVAALLVELDQTLPLQVLRNCCLASHRSSFARWSLVGPRNADSGRKGGGRARLAVNPASNGSSHRAHLTGATNGTGRPARVQGQIGKGSLGGRPFWHRVGTATSAVPTDSTSQKL